MKLRPYLSNLTAKGYSSLFTGKGEKSDKIKLCLINEKYLDELNVSQEGRFSYKNDWLKPIDFSKVLKPIDDNNIDLPLLQVVYSIFYQSLIEKKSYLNGNALTMKITVFANYMDTNIRGGGYKTFFEKLQEFEKVYVLQNNGKTATRFLTLAKLDTTNGIVIFDVATLADILNQIREENTISVKKPHKKTFIFETPTHSFLIHSNISRKNQNAYFLVTQIEALLVQAGSNTTEVHITFENLIKKVPSLWAVMESDMLNTDKNKYLKRTFSKMYALLKKNTDLYKYFTELDIQNTIPTPNKLNQVLRITHKGINKEYKPEI